jgi:hypothetical protein
MRTLTRRPRPGILVGALLESAAVFVHRSAILALRFRFEFDSILSGLLEYPCGRPWEGLCQGLCQGL